MYFNLFTDRHLITHLLAWFFVLSWHRQAYSNLALALNTIIFLKYSSSCTYILFGGMGISKIHFFVNARLCFPYRSIWDNLSKTSFRKKLLDSYDSIDTLFYTSICTYGSGLFLRMKLLSFYRKVAVDLAFSIFAIRIHLFDLHFQSCRPYLKYWYYYVISI